ncbi:MAG: alkaline phosphatase D family protein [Gammaproteobacteria bacterium]|nr:alkaline phosphatase D family protein [Gammaproteobacteria bacterium]
MKRFVSFVLLILAPLLLQLLLQPRSYADDFRVAFGSCSRTDLDQPLWDAVLGRDPDLWIWTGDIVYADTTKAEVFKAKYDKQKRQPGYAAVVGAMPVIGVWDDHDYGRNGGGKEFTAKRVAQRALLEFLDEPGESARWTRDGIYDSGLYAGGRVKVILLDTRFNRDKPGENGDVLGPNQWAWLEAELAGSDAQFHLIVSSIQVVPQEHRYEKWANFPASRDRLFRLIAQHRVPGVVFLSGDRHIGELSRRDTQPYPLYDITSSSMTHSWSTFPGEPNSQRVGEVFTGLNFGEIHIDWDTGRVDIGLVDRNGVDVLALEVPFADLGVDPSQVSGLSRITNPSQGTDSSQVTDPYRIADPAQITDSAKITDPS